MRPATRLALSCKDGFMKTFRHLDRAATCAALAVALGSVALTALAGPDWKGFQSLVKDRLTLAGARVTGVSSGEAGDSTLLVVVEPSWPASDVPAGDREKHAEQWGREMSYSDLQGTFEHLMSVLKVDPHVELLTEVAVRITPGTDERTYTAVVTGDVFRKFASGRYDDTALRTNWVIKKSE